MDHLWRLLTAIFIIAASVGLFVIGWILSGGDFHDYFTAIIAIFIVPAGIVWGICRGVRVIIDHAREHK